MLYRGVALTSVRTPLSNVEYPTSARLYCSRRLRGWSTLRTSARNVFTTICGAGWVGGYHIQVVKWGHLELGCRWDDMFICRGNRRGENLVRSQRRNIV